MRPFARRSEVLERKDDAGSSSGGGVEQGRLNGIMGWTDQECHFERPGVQF